MRKFLYRGKRFLSSGLAQNKRDGVGIVLESKIILADVGRTKLANTLPDFADSGFPKFLHECGMFSKLHQHDRERSALLQGTPGFSQEHVDIGSSLQQAGVFVRDGKIFNQTS